MKILGLETSCDETAAAIVENGVKVHSNIVASSSEFHQKYGGIVPEIAARQQAEVIIPVISAALVIPIEEINAIAVTVGPGLVGSLLVGVETAKTLSWVWGKPLVPVNHLVGHLYANWINGEIPDPKQQIFNKSSVSATQSKTVGFPAVVLIVSGGHTELVLMEDHGRFKRLGGTRDDAAGEAFDKVARILNLGFPGGPAIEKAATGADPAAFNFPRPLLHEDSFDFSFSGLKTAVLRATQALKIPTSHLPWSNLPIADLACSFQEAVVEVLVSKTIRAVQKYQARSLLLAGGVAANKRLRQKLFEVIQEKLPTIQFFPPLTPLCTDNAVMIAAAAYFNYQPLPPEKVRAESNLSVV